MEQVGTAFVQVIPSMRGFHQSIGRQLRTGMGQVGAQSGRTFTRRMLDSVNRGMKAVGAGITHTTRAITTATVSAHPATSSGPKPAVTPATTLLSAPATRWRWP